MKKTLSNSPLVYVLAQVKISPIMELEGYIPKLQGLLRKDFPLFNTIDIQTVEIRPQGEPEFKRIKQWHFADRLATTGIIADTNAITIHSTQHDTYENLAKKFERVLTKFNQELDIGLYTRVGLRYVNAIHSEPESYLDKSLLGFNMQESTIFRGKYVARTETLQETNYGLIKIKTSRFSSKDFMEYDDIKNLLIPMELIQGANYLNFDIHENKFPIGSYAILDTDHFSGEMEKNEDFDISKISENLKNLHEGIHEVFNRAITKIAFEKWE